MGTVNDSAADEPRPNPDTEHPDPRTGTVNDDSAADRRSTDDAARIAPSGEGAAAWRRGVELFEQGDYWECHEALEPLWLVSDGIERHFYGGVILLAAALHKARSQRQPRGGRRNYAKALTHLALVPDRYHGVDVRELEARVHRALRSDDHKPQIPEGSDRGT